MPVARAAFATTSGWGMLGLGVAMDTVGIFLIKRTVSGSAPQLDLEAFRQIAGLFLTEPPAIAGLLLFLLAPVAMAYGLSRLDLSVAYPVQVGFSFVCVLVLSAILGESLTLSRGFGVGLIAAGTWVMISSSREAA